MRHLQNSLAGLIVSLPLLAGTAAHAQETAAHTPATAPLVRHFEAAGIRGELLTVGEDKALTAGSAAFAQIKLSSDISGRRQRGASAEILVEAENGEVASVAGSGIKTQNDGAAIRARIDGLRKGRERVVLVEVKLPKEAAGRTRLKVLLRAASDAPAEAAAEISWNIKDCAGGYYGALQQIREKPELNVARLWKEAAAGDPALSRSWLFGKEERRSRRSRRSRRDGGELATSRKQREILAEAGRLVRAGKDPMLEADAGLGWVLSKVASDLDAYSSQPLNPAICTGAPGLADWYSGRLESVGKRGERLAQLAADAKLLARERAEAAFAAARALPENAPNWGAVTPVSARAMAIGEDSLKGLAVSLAGLAGLAPEALDKVKQAPAPYDALIQLRDAGFEADAMPETLREPVRAALTAIDAAARIEIAHTRHMALQSAFEARIKAIRNAHATHCVCRS